MKLKQCSSCRVKKAPEKFSPHKTSKDGLHFYCKDCRSKKNTAQASSWCRENREQKNKTQRGYYWRRKARLAAAKLRGQSV